MLDIFKNQTIKTNAQKLLCLTLKFITILVFVSFAEEDITERDTPPEFRRLTRDTKVVLGEPATFDCQVSGKPKPEVYWTKVRVVPPLELNTSSHILKMSCYLNVYYKLLLFILLSSCVLTCKCIVERCKYTVVIGMLTYPMYWLL